MGVAILALSPDKEIRIARKIYTENCIGLPRLWKIRNETNQFLDTHIQNSSDIKNICVEGPSLYSVNKPDHAGQARGAIYMMCMDLCLEPSVIPQEIPPKSLKLFATGNGDALKDKMMETAVQHGWIINNDDEADAAWLAELACALMEEKPLTRKQLEAIRGIRKMSEKKPHTSNSRGINI
jgi:Holliday junction resolvasome RuvABC endonuclease subunit